MVVTGGTTGVAGYIAGRLTSADLKSLLSQVLDGVFKFLHEQGSTAAFVLVITVGFGWFGVWAIRKLIEGKQAEIDRICADRDKFQGLIINQWKSTRGNKGK
jgi:hypothetical protein